MFILGVKSGFRISEILSLTIGDVVAKGSIMDTVHVNKRCYMKKKTEGRTIPLNPAAKNIKLLLQETAAVVSAREDKKLNDKEYANLQKRYLNYFIIFHMLSLH